MERTHRWALRSLAARTNPAQALFAIVQGGVVAVAAARVGGVPAREHPFDGFAIGGLAVGDSARRARGHDRARRRALARGAAALPHGRRHAARSAARHRLRRRHVRLRHADDAGVAGHGVHLDGPRAHHARAQSPARRAARRGLRLHDVQDIQPRATCTTSSSAASRSARACLSMHNLAPLPGAHGRGARGHRRRRLRRVRARARSSRSTATSTPRRARERQQRAERGHEVVRTRGGALADAQPRRAARSCIPASARCVEAELLYVAQSRLDERLRAAARTLVAVFDVGLGAGSNALAARAASERAPAAPRRLELVSFERDLGALDARARARGDFGLDGDAGLRRARAARPTARTRRARTSWLLAPRRSARVARARAGARRRRLLGSVLAARQSRRCGPSPPSPRCAVAVAALRGRLHLQRFHRDARRAVAGRIRRRRRRRHRRQGARRPPPPSTPRDLARPLDRAWLSRLSRPDAPLPADAPADAVARAAAAPQFR